MRHITQHILVYLQFFAIMEISDCWAVQYQGRDVWKCAGMRPGALYVMAHGLQMMPMWPASSLDSPDLVCSWLHRVH